MGRAPLRWATQYVHAHVIALDVSMPGRTGVDLIKQIKTEVPALRISALTMHAEHRYAVRAFKAGAAGSLTKDSASEELVAPVTKVAAGDVYVSLSMAESLAQSLSEPSHTFPHQRLSDRELDVFRRLSAGQPLSELAEARCVSAKPISTYKTRILEKMQMPHDVALIQNVVRHNVLDEND